VIARRIAPGLAASAAAASLGAFGALGALGALGACGDNLPGGDGGFAPVSGARLALQKYRYDDGTELAVSSEFYDTQLHTRCAPQAWSDGAVRCAPVADDVQYADAACTMLVGLGRTISQPTFFVARDPQPGGTAVRVFRAGGAAPALTQYYSLTGGACTGPTPVPPGISKFFAVGDELGGDALVAFHDAEIDGDRLALALRETDDGLRVVTGLRDRALGVACTAAAQTDGSMACAPAGAAIPTYFADPGCTLPVVAADAGAPALARITEPSGCTSYHRVGRELSPPVYQRDDHGTCVPVAAPASGRLFAVEAPIDLPALDRRLEPAAGRRLQRVVLGHGDLAFLDGRLFDTQTGADCVPRTLRDATRCLPADLVAATTVFSAGCTDMVRVAEVPQHGCTPAGFATTARPFQLRAIGDVAAGMFQLRTDGCQPYTGGPGNELRSLGPPLDLTAFETAVYFGERAATP
jgi:hypothetical protein